MPAARTYEGVIPDYCQPIPGAPDYYADREGNIYSTKRGEFLSMKKTITSQGYVSITLIGKDGVAKRNWLAHRLIAETFLGSAPGLQVNHINCERADNRVENLEWVTASDNIKYMYKLGRNFPQPGTDNHRTKLTPEDVKNIRDWFAAGITKTEIARRVNTTPTSVGRLINGKSYKHQ